MLHPVDSRTLCLSCSFTVGRGLASDERLHVGILKEHGAYDIIYSENLNLAASGRGQCVTDSGGQIRLFLDRSLAPARRMQLDKLEFDGE